MEPEEDDVPEFCEIECCCGSTIWTNGDVDTEDEDGTIEHECDGDEVEDDD